MKPSEALGRHRVKIREAAGRFPVANPRVFGSVARGHDQSNSDLDILVRRQIQQQKPGIICGRPLWMQSRSLSWSLIRRWDVNPALQEWHVRCSVSRRGRATGRAP